MITLCTVVPDNTQTDFLYKDFADIMIDSMLRNTKFITNVLIIWWGLEEVQKVLMTHNILLILILRVVQQ